MRNERINVAYHIPGRGLGRHIGHDERSRSFAIVPRASAAKTTIRKRIIPILDQGDTSACTGNAKTGALGSEGLYESVNPVMQSKGYSWDEAFARDTIYSLATKLDNFSGAWKPDDTGSDGLSASKAAFQLGLSSGYTHALSVDAMSTGLQAVAGIMGINWYDSFDDIDSSGVLQLPATAKVRGGHEIHVLNVNFEKDWFECCQSWGLGWGIQGHFYMPFPVAERLLKEDGDAAFDVPLTSAPPVPKPVTPTAGYSAADLDLKKYLDIWGVGVVSKITKAGQLNEARKRWEAAHA